MTAYVVSKAPFRISLFGGGTDMPEYFSRHTFGQVLSTAISRAIYIHVKRRSDGAILYRDNSDEVYAENSKVLQCGRLKACLEYLNIRDGVEIQSQSDLPRKGSGLGGSSSFCVGLLNALSRLFNVKLSAHDLALGAYHIERHVLGESVGMQDQAAAAFGGIRHYKFFHDNHICADKISSLWLSGVLNKCLVYSTGASRSANAVLADQAMRMSSPQGLSSMNDLFNSVSVALEAIEARDLPRLGTICHEGWMAKRSLTPLISSPFIDEMYDIGIRAGAFGGKLLGAGGGGYLIFLVDPATRNSVMRALEKYSRLVCGFGSKGSITIRYG